MPSTMDTPANSLDDFPPESFTVLAFCDTCDYRAPLDRTRVPPGVTVQALRGRLRCSACGHRGTSIRIVYAGAGGFRYGCRNAVPERLSGLVTPWAPEQDTYGGDGSGGRSGAQADVQGRRVSGWSWPKADRGFRAERMGSRYVGSNPPSQNQSLACQAR